MSGESGGRICLSKLNDQLTCKLCGGYFIDATTIIECLHSFCKSCIVKYLETNKYCPICEVQVHKSKPLLNIRPDHTLQDIVYKLVPGCYQNEMRCRREFYEKHPEAKLTNMSPEARGEPIESHIYSPDESLSLSLEYYNPNLTNDTTVISPMEESKESTPPLNSNKVLPRRYLRCPAAVTVFHLQKLLRAKYGLSDVHRVDVMYKEESLCSNYTLMDVMYIYHWRRKVPLHLSYRIFESSPKRLKLSDDNTHFQESLNNAGICQPMEMKEVQLKISETGVMSFTGVSGSPDSKKSPKNKLNIENDHQSNQNVSVSIKNEEKQSTSDEKVSNNVKKNSGEEEAKSNEHEKKTNTPKIFSERKSTSNNNNSNNSTNTNNNNSSSSSNSSNSNNNSGGGSNNTNTQDAVSKPETREKSKNSETNLLAGGSGSKIDALSVKLQFQPKVGQINNTYSKKSLKEKKTILEKVLKKYENKSMIADGLKESPKNAVDKSRSVTSLTIYPSKSNSTSKITSSLSQSAAKSNETFNASSVPFSTISTSSSSSSSSSISITTRRNSSPDRNKEFNTSNSNALSNFNKRGGSSNENNEGCNQKSTVSINSKGPFTRQSNLSNDSSNSGVNNNVSTMMNNISQSESSYGVQDLLNSTMKNTLKNSAINIGQKSTITSVATTTPTTTSQINIQSSSMSAYSISNITKTTFSTSNSNSGGNNSYNSSSNNNNNNAGSNSSNQSGNSSTRQENSKGNSEMSVYAVPPCPDAIPISLMKPTVRKTEIISKGTNLNEICAKIGTSGSKINDICAKIGEHSKEKNKAEKSRPEIPDLLKITKKSMTSTSSDMIKHISNIPNVPIYTPSSLLGSKNNDLSKESTAISSTATTTLSTSSAMVVSSSMLTTNVLSALPSSMSVTTTTLSTSTVPSLISSHASGLVGKGNSLKKSQSSAVGYKTLRDPPKSWNPTLSKNNYVAVKNQAKEIQNIQITSVNSSESSSSLSNTKPIMSKPAKIFKMRNMPRYLGNPASGVKPMYSVNNDAKEGKDQQSTASAVSKNNVTTTGLSSMTKIDPKTLAPISSTNTNSPIISLPPYSSSRSYQNTPFSRSSNSPLSPRNSPVNMLSTNPFIPSPTPNTNPRLIYSHFPPPAFATDANRFPNPLIRSPIGIPPPSAFHSSLPPSINKLYQRSSYIPQTTTTAYSQGLNTQPVSSAMQRIPSSNYSSPSKSSKTTVTNSNFNVKSESTASTSLESIVHLSKGISHDSNIFNLSTTTGIMSNYASDLSKNSSSPLTTGDILINPVVSTNSMKSFGSDGKAQGKSEEKSEDSDKKEKSIKNNKEKERSDEDKRPSDIGNKETGEKLSDKSNKNEEKLNDEAKQNDDDKSKEKKDKLMKKKTKEIDKKINKRILRKDSNDTDKNIINNEDSKTSESNDSSSNKNEVADQLIIKINGNQNAKPNDKSCNDDLLNKLSKVQSNETTNQQSGSNFSSEDEKLKLSNKLSVEESKKNQENSEGCKGEPQKKDED